MKNKVYNFHKRILFNIFCVVLLNLSSNAQYTLTDNDVMVWEGVIFQCVTSIDDWGIGDIVIPDTLWQQAIVGIEGWAFHDKQITGLTLPNQIKFIGWDAFSINNISDLSLPDSLISIDYGGFEYNNLKTIVIPKSVTNISMNAFADNEITDISFEENSNIRIINQYAFQNNRNAKITFPINANEHFNGYVDSNGKLYDVGSKVSYNTELYYFANLPKRRLRQEDVVIDNGEIIECAFYKDISIPEIINNEKITSIGNECFEYHNLFSIEIPLSVKSINYRSFLGNELFELELPNSISIIEEGAFLGNKIDTIIIPPSVKIIGKESFAQNGSRKLILPNGIETIEEYAFNSNRFSEALLPSSITKIETGAFYSYTNVYLDEVIDSIQLPNPVIKEGYSFNCWINGNGDTVTAMTDLETSYTAAFSEATFYQVSGTVITEEPNGLLLFLSGDFNGVQTVDDSGNFLFPLNEGRTVKITPERKGYVFDPENISIDNIQTDRYNLYFTSIIQSYEVNFFAGENGSLSGDVYQNIEYKQTTSPVTAIPNDGYMFKVWVDKNENEVGVENPIVIDVRNQMEVTAIFEPLLSIESNVFVSVNCYPNPIVNTATIVASKNIQKVEIYDIFGNLVFSNEKTYGYKYCLDLEKYANGVYFIKVKGEGFEETMKVVVK